MAKSTTVEGTSELLLEDAAHQLAGEWPKHNDFVEPVLELGPERARNCTQNLFPGKIGSRGREPDFASLVYGRTKVSRQDEETVTEIGGVPQSVGEPAL